MNFSDNFKTIIKTIGCSNKELAEVCSLDVTIISKFKNDIRIPTEGSSTLESLINGICQLAINKQKVSQLSKVCNSNKDNIVDLVSDFLINNSINIRLKKEDNTLIGENLEILMNTLNITNVMLAKYLNKDESLISKYKSGKRFIMRNDLLVDQLCKYFSNYIKTNHLSDKISFLLGTANITTLNTDILTFLFTKHDINSPIDSFLESLNDFKFNFSPTIPTINSLVPDNCLYSKKNTYIGINGFREAVKKFLGNTCLYDNTTTLYLYSDESMKWMIQDKAFYNTWKMLMINSLMKKNRIKIIHNVNRNADEMFRAIESWLPLYMTGLIEPYYNIKNNNNIFNHTLFIVDKVAVINSLSPFNNKNDNNIYNYSDDINIIESYKEQFIQLLDKSNRLIKIYINDEIDKKTENTNNYTEFCSKVDSIIIKIKNDKSEALVLKTNNPKILFEFNYSIIIDSLNDYVSKTK